MYRVHQLIMFSYVPQKISTHAQFVPEKKKLDHGFSNYVTTGTPAIVYWYTSKY